MSRTELCLLEYLPTDRRTLFRSKLFGFVRGHAEEIGIGVRWLCFGVDNVARPPQRYVRGLTDADVAHLCAALDAQGTTHLLCNDPPTPAVRERLLRQRPGLRIIVAASGAIEALHDDELEAWLDDPTGRRPPGSVDVVQLGARRSLPERPLLVDVTEPSYTCEAGNELATTIAPTSISTNSSCMSWRTAPAPQT